MDWDLSNTTEMIIGIISILVGLVIIKWPRVLVTMVGLYFIVIGALTIVSATD